MLGFLSVEWGAAVARAYPQISAAAAATRMHIVLPDLPSVISPSLTSEFYTQVVPPQKRILTIAACRHSERSLIDCLVQQQLDTQQNVDHIMIVGGNDKGGCGSLGTLEAIRIANRLQPLLTDSSLTVWATANPNCKSSLQSVVSKLDAGATGIITQPLLSSHAVETLQTYPTAAALLCNSSTGITYVAGLALPTSAASLLFWSKLLAAGHPPQQQHQPPPPCCLLEDDPLFRDHVRYFAHGGGIHNSNSNSNSNYSSTRWAKNQAQMLSEIDMLSGIHYMPLHNTPDLLAILWNRINEEKNEGNELH
jgi:hypothetical protein